MKIKFFNALLCLIASSFLCASDELPSWSISGEFLWMKVEESGLNWAFRGLSSATSSSVRSNTPYIFKYDWEAGYRVKGAWINNEWAIEANWTHFTTTTHDSIAAPFLISDDQFDGADLLGGANSFLNPTIIFYRGSRGNAKFKLKVDWSDISISRTFKTAEDFDIKVQIGARGLWRNHKLHIEGDTDPSDATYPSTISYHLSNPTWGYGLQTALIGAYRINSKLTFEGLFGGALLYSQNKIHQRFIKHNVGSNVQIDSFLNFSSYNRNQTCDPMLDMSAKLIYEGELKGFLMQLYGGWEQHVIFNAYKNIKSGNMTLSAVNLGATVLF